MTWAEQRIRDRMLSLDSSGSISLTTEEVQGLFTELYRQRDALKRIRDQAQGHVDDRQPGWGRWSTTLRLAKEGLNDFSSSNLGPVQPPGAP